MVQKFGTPGFRKVHEAAKPAGQLDSHTQEDDRLADLGLARVELDLQNFSEENQDIATEQSDVKSDRRSNPNIVVSDNRDAESSERGEL